jgi:hypothetical protein
MNWEAISAISAAITALVILATAIYAARQVQALNAQIDHLRRATQLDGTLAVFDEIFSADFMTAYRFVLNDFESRIHEEAFHAEALERAPDTDVHKERQVMRHMERIGTLIRNELLDAEVVIDFGRDIITQTWKRLKPLVLEQRRYLNDYQMWENFEYMAHEVERVDARTALERKR